MAGELTTTITFADGDQVTSAKLNQIISGAAFTSSAVTGTTLTVTGGKLKVGTITSSELGTGCVTSTAIAANAVTAGRILNGNVTTEKLADDAVTGAKIADGVITASHFSAALSPTAQVMKNETGGYIVTPDFVQHSQRVAKCHGCVELGVSSRTLQNGSVNVTSVSRDSSTSTRVVLATDMGSSSYTVLATWESSSTADNQTVSIYSKAAGDFYIKHPAEAANRRINFIVFGNYAT